MPTEDIDLEQTNIILTPLTAPVPLIPRRPLWAYQMVARLLDSFRSRRQKTTPPSP